MIDHLILGFLMYGDMNGYVLKQSIECGPSYFSNVSFGSIYPALKRLESAGFVSMTPVSDGKRLKKNYHLLPKGESLLMQWLEMPIQSAKAHDLLLTKVFFYEFLAVEQVEKLMQKYLELVEEEMMVLNGIAQHVESESGRYQFSTLVFGQEYYAFLHRWVVSFMNKIAHFPVEDRNRYKKIMGGGML